MYVRPFADILLTHYRSISYSPVVKPFLGVQISLFFFNNRKDIRKILFFTLIKIFCRKRLKIRKKGKERKADPNFETSYAFFLALALTCALSIHFVLLVAFFSTLFCTSGRPLQARRTRNQRAVYSPVVACQWTHAILRECNSRATRRATYFEL